MAVRLKNINESLERLYESSNTSLTEAFDESFPKWLKDRLIQVKNYHGTDKTNDRDVGKVPRENRPSYISPRGYMGKDRDLGLFSSLLKHGIDLQNLKVVEGPVPEKRTDERLKSPNVPIWHFPNGQVYIPGINDNEETDINPGKVGAFKYVPSKYLMSTADAFAYFDESNLGTDKYSQTRQDRAEHSKELRDIKYGRQGKDPEQFVPYTWRSSNTHYDASGYLVDPTVYKDKLDEIRASNYSVELEKIHNIIKEYSEDISAALQYYDPFENEDEYNTLNKNLSRLRDAVRAYNRYANRITDIANDIAISDDYKRKYIKTYLSDLKGDYDVREIMNNSSDIFLSGVNWLE